MWQSLPSQKEKIQEQKLTAALYLCQFPLKNFRNIEFLVCQMWSKTQLKLSLGKKQKKTIFSEQNWIFAEKIQQNSRSIM